jgi:hypothetical protein
LERRVEELERRFSQSGIYSENFLSRAFTVWGHFIVAHLLIVLAVALPLGLLSVLLSAR